MTARDDAWQERFRARAVHWTEPAAGDRTRALAMSNRTGVGQLYTWEIGTNALAQITDRPEGTVEGAISADGTAVFFVDDDHGDEIGHWVRVSAGGGATQDLTPNLAPYTSYDISVSADGRHIAFTAVAADESTVHIVTGLGSQPGSPRAVFRSRSLCSTTGFDHAGTHLFVLSSDRSEKVRYSLLAIDVESGERQAELWDGDETSISNVVPSTVSGDPRVLAASDRTGERRPLTWDPTSGDRRDLPLGEMSGEVVPVDWSPDGGEILLRRTHDAVQELWSFDVGSAHLRKLDAPVGMYGYWAESGVWFGAGGIVAQWQDASHPATVLLLDRQTGRPIRDLLPPEAVPASQPWRSVSYVVDVDQPIQAWLATPAGHGPFPAVIETHGGPASVTMQSFQPRAQAWLDRGFCFLSINYRGSTTFGRAFRESIWGRIGELEVRDIVAGRQYLIEQGIARADQILLTGWSYGGYLTLQAMGVAPGLWAGGMAGVAVADWVSEYEDENDVLRAYDRAYFGGAPDEKMADYVRASPLTYADRVDAPVLIIQGRNDTRCPARQVELYEARMKGLGKPIEVIWFDAGHLGGGDIERAIEHQAAMMEFADRALGRPAG